MPKRYGAYVAGAWRETGVDAVIRSPWDGAEVATISLCRPEDIEDAVAGAVRAFAETRKLAAYERATICREISAALAARKDELAMAMCLEGGKPMGDARAEVDRGVHTFEIAAAEAERLGGEVIPLDLRPTSAGRLGITRRVPIGPIAAISPFNFPINLAAHKVAPAIAAGCPVVLKPAPQTPISCLLLAEIIAATAWPKEALSVVPSMPDVANALVVDERLKLLTFTGSPAVGWELKKRAGKKKVVLELGSNSAVVVDETADLAYAVPRIVYGAFSYAGQKCIKVQRLYVHERIYDRFVDEFLKATRVVKVGDPKDLEVLVGPLIDEKSAARVDAWVEEAKARGATMLAGGARHGNVVPPTVLTDVPRDARVSCEEVFGPVVVVEKYTDFSAALAAVNDSPFGLQAGVFTENLDRAFEAFAELDVGGVIVNDIPTYRVDHMPYGGVKNSGLGREGIRYALEDMTEIRIMVVNSRHHA
jgi:acyl-CoA reductase-like NAD-dependent aldehyde dehydrogenase